VNYDLLHITWTDTPVLNINLYIRFISLSKYNSFTQSNRSFKPCFKTKGLLVIIFKRVWLLLLFTLSAALREFLSGTSSNIIFSTLNLVYKAVSDIEEDLGVDTVIIAAILSSLFSRGGFYYL